MEVLLLIVLLAIFLASGQRHRLFGTGKRAKRLVLRDIFWR
jgi:hypothetical protein